jgi:hypothetical protein
MIEAVVFCQACAIRPTHSLAPASGWPPQRPFRFVKSAGQSGEPATYRAVEAIKILISHRRRNLEAPAA